MRRALADDLLRFLLVKPPLAIHQKVASGPMASRVAAMRARPLRPRCTRAKREPRIIGMQAREHFEALQGAQAPETGTAVAKTRRSRFAALQMAT